MSRRARPLMLADELMQITNQLNSFGSVYMLS